ncbi:MAG: hypothetical protein U9R42_13320 [Bacteroidota bacterium]|nr:hypothetical protein [Bacteroidota bacterium]
MKNIIILIIIAFFTLSTQAQIVLFERETDDFSDDGKNGPNLSNFSHAYMGYGILLGTIQEGADIRIPHSQYFQIGYRYKKKLFQYLSLGTDIQYRTNYFSLKQNNTKTLVDTVLHKKEKLIFKQIELSGFLRFNFSKRRGNFIGNYLDIGAGESWTMKLSHKTIDKTNNLKTKIEVNGFEYYEAFNNYVFARIGFNRYVVTGTYRLSNLFKPNSNYPELPEFSVGVEIGLF